MKNILLIIFAAALVAASFSCKDGDGHDGKQKEAQKFDFRKAIWGMNREEVKASESATPTGDRPELITYRDNFEGIPAIVGYLFEKDKLVRGGYLMQSSYEDPKNYISDYDTIKGRLIKDYGSPAQDDMVWKEGEEVSDPAKYGESVCSGKLRYSTMWSDGRTVIRETLDGEGGKCNLGIIFESLEMYVNPAAEKNKAPESSPAP